MKKFTLALLVIFVIAAIIFFVLLSGSGPEYVPTDIKVIDLPDTYEK